MDEGTGPEADRTDKLTEPDAIRRDLTRMLARRRWILPTIGAHLAVALPYWALHYGGRALGHPILPGSTGAVVMLVLSVLSVPSALALMVLISFQWHGRAVLREAATNESGGLPAALDCLTMRSYRGTPEIDRALARRLLTMDQSDPARITREQMLAIRAVASIEGSALYGYPAAPELLLAVLHCLVVTGDLKSLPIAERLAQRAKQPEVRAAAAEAAAKLRALQAGGTLLRPADGAAEELLRPADAAVDPEVLLRASDEAAQQSRTSG